MKDQFWWPLTVRMPPPSMKTLRMPESRPLGEGGSQDSERHLIVVAHQLHNLIQQVLQILIANLVCKAWDEGFGFFGGITAK